MQKLRGIIVILCIVAFSFISYLVIAYGTLKFDTIISEAFYSIRMPGLNTLAEMITYAGDWETIVVICLLLLIYPKTRKVYGIPVAVTAIATTAVKTVVKVLVARPRPDVALRLIEQGGYSYPSGHSITSIAVYGLLIFLIQANMKDRKKANILSVLLGILAIVIGLSRIYIGVHYPTDVLGGWFAGIAIMVAVLMGLDSLKKRNTLE